MYLMKCISIYNKLIKQIQTIERVDSKRWPSHINGNNNYINEKNTYSSVSENTDTYSRASQLMNKEKLPI